jgi:hypothetical protein
MPLLRYCGSLREYEERLRVGLEAYLELVEGSMGYPRERELESASEALGLLDCDAACRALQEVLGRLEDAEVCVITPAPGGLELLTKGGCEKVVATDSSIETLAEAGRRPDVLVGDADPSLRLLGLALQLGVPYLLHSHGDNLYRLKPLTGLLRRSAVILTTQVETPYCTLPVGAFTDGDRGAAIAMYFRASRVIINWLSSQGPSCEHKDLCDEGLKALKLRLAQRVLTYMASRLGYRVEAAGDQIILERA